MLKYPDQENSQGTPFTENEILVFKGEELQDIDYTKKIIQELGLYIEREDFLYKVNH